MSRIEYQPLIESDDDDDESCTRCKCLLVLMSVSDRRYFSCRHRFCPDCMQDYVTAGGHNRTKCLLCGTRAEFTEVCNTCRVKMPASYVFEHASYCQ